VSRTNRTDPLAIVVGALALFLTGWDYWLFSLSSYDIGAALVALQVVAIPGLWIASIAWYRGRWLLASCGLLAGLLGGYGYFYIPPLICLILSGVALRRFFAQRRSHVEQPAG